MRIQPTMFKNNFAQRNLKKLQTQFERNRNFQAKNEHQYTGLVSVDLAYGSMLDNAIAKDLRTIGLI